MAARRAPNGYRMSTPVPPQADHAEALRLAAALGEAGRLALLVPVKALDDAKTRLAALLSSEERRTLAGTLLDGVLSALAGLPPAVPRYVVSSYDPAIERAEALGFTALREARQHSESRSVDEAAAALAGRGHGGVLRLPLDLPLFSLAALSPVLAAVTAGEDVVLVPSRDGTGTNAIYRAPPTCFTSRFGPDSLRLHGEAAAAAGRPAHVVPVAALGLDIDEPEDLAALLQTAPDCPAARLLTDWGVPERLKAAGRGIA